MTNRRNEIAPTDLPVPPERALIPQRLQLALAYVDAVRRAPARKSLRSQFAQIATHQQSESEGARS